jgi:hypothetical protein
MQTGLAVSRTCAMVSALIDRHPFDRSPFFVLPFFFFNLSRHGQT